MQQGELTGEAWGGMPCKLFFEHRVIPDITHAYYAHPTAWNEIGFGGPASPRGYVRMGLDRRDPWEAVEAKPGEEANGPSERTIVSADPFARPTRRERPRSGRLQARRLGADAPISARTRPSISSSSGPARAAAR